MAGHPRRVGPALVAPVLVALLTLAACGQGGVGPAGPGQATTGRPATTASGPGPTFTGLPAPAPLPIEHTVDVGLPAPPAASSPGPAPGQQDLIFVSATRGFLVTGAPPGSAAAEGGASIEATSDGGASWSSVWHEAGASLDWVGRAGSAVVASGVVAPPGSTDPARATPLLVRSNDGGRSWTTSEPALPAAMGRGSQVWGWGDARLDFVSGSLGFALPDSEMGEGTLAPGLLRSTDGGAHWSQVALPGGRPTGGLAFTTAVDGFATGTGLSPGTGKGCESEIWVTADAGASWHVLAGTCVAYVLDALSFTSPHAGFAAGGNFAKYGLAPQRAVLATTDGGAHWAPRYLAGGSASGGSQSSGGPFATIDFPTPQLGYALTGGCSLGANGPCGGRVWTSTDGGRSWSETANVGTRLALAGPEDLWTVDSNGGMGGTVLWHSTDGGATWHPVARPSALAVSALVASGPLVFAQTAAGDYQSRDGGIHWHAVEAPGLAAAEQPAGSTSGPADGALAPAVVQPGGLVVLVGAGGLWVSHDGGRTGSVVGLPGLEGAAGGPAQVAFADPRHGMVLTGGEPCANPAKPGSQPTSSQVLASRDGGRSWTRVGSLALSPSGLGLGAGTAVAVGAGCPGQAQVATSTDGGRRWARWSLPAGLDCTSAGAAGATLGLGCLSSDNQGDQVPEMLVSHDGGRHWTAYRVSHRGPDEPQLLGPVVAAPGQLWVYGPPGALWHSSDGAASWTALSPDLPAPG